MNSAVSLRTKLSILSVGLLSFVGILVETSMTVAFPALITAFGVGLDTVQWLTTGYLLLVTIVMSTTAYVLKQVNPKTLFLFAATVCLVGGLLCLVASSFPILLIGRLLQAVATGLSTPLMFQIIFTRVPGERVGVYTGAAAVIISLAPALGPTYGGIMTSLWSWRAIFVGIIPLLVLVALSGSFTIDGTAPKPRDAGFDYIGAALIAALFTVVLFTFTAAGSNGWLSLQFGLWVLACIAIAVVLFLYARKSKRRLFDYSILRLKKLRLRLFNYFSLQFINIGLSFVLPLFAQRVLGTSALVAGLMVLPGALVGAFTSPIAGHLYDSMGASKPLIFSASLVSVGSLLFLAFSSQLSIALIAFFYVVLRLGFNSGFGVAMSDASVQVSLSQKSDQNSLFNMMQQYAGSLGTSVMSAVISSFELTRTSATATALGARIDFVIMLVLALSILVLLCRSVYKARHSHGTSDGDVPVTELAKG